MRAYAKVRVGFDIILLHSFTPGTAEEDKAAEAVKGALAVGGAEASVSVQCSGALKEYPVIGESPIVGNVFSGPSTAPMSAAQLAMLQLLADGGEMQVFCQQISTARGLIRREFVERVKGKPDGEWWVKITKDGKIELAP